MDDKIGVVTVTYNSAIVIDGFMKSIIKQKEKNFILYIIDNKSSDDTLKRIDKYKNSEIEIRIIMNESNLGVAAANNQGIILAIEDACNKILLINNDVEFNHDLFRSLLIGMKKYSASIVVPKIKYFGPSNKLWYAGGYFQKWRGYHSIHRGEAEIDIGQFDYDEIIEYAPTCCMLIDRGVFDKIGYMDEKYFVYYDDTDFCLRAYKNAIKIYYLYKSELFHKVSSLTGGGSSSFGIRYTARNRIYYMKKNLFFPLSWIQILACQLILFINLILRRDTLDVYFIKQKALFDGLRL